MLFPSGRIMAWYGDDFTGSAAVMEEFAFAGLESVLFLDVPNQVQLDRFSNAQTIGLAGTSRAHGPAWMDENLAGAFSFLRSLEMPLNLYKICSTLDSSPAIGSIGKAISLARPAFGDAPVPVFPSSLNVGRYQCFGNLFAESGDQVFRLDRHPIVSNHPVTPMDEADVARHLALQTDESIGLISLVDLDRAEDRFQALSRQSIGLVSVDAQRPSDFIQCGRLFASLPQASLIAGSQGVAEALIAYWRSINEIPQASFLPKPGAAKAMVGLSGSLSAITRDQIDHALENGFVGVQLDTVRCITQDRNLVIEETITEALRILSEGKSPLIFSARGNNDPAVAAHQHSATQNGLTSEAANALIGSALGEVLCRLVDVGAVTRAAIAGGDSSGYALKRLDRLALTALAPISPGAGIYTAHARDRHQPIFEIALKGGQMGSASYFSDIRAGAHGQ